MQNDPVPEDVPYYAVSESTLHPVMGDLKATTPIEPNRMFYIRQSLDVYKKKYPGQPTYDASQGDGGASLPGTPRFLLERAAEMQIEHGTAYDQPNGTEGYRKAVAEKYWQLDASSGLTAENVLATSGGRDALQKAYQAMLYLGHGRFGDVLIVSRVPWMCYTWGPYGIGANVMLSPGDPKQGWAHTREGIEACVRYAAKTNRKVMGLVITSPDNPTGLVYSPEKQIELAHAALDAGIPYVLFDWMYHQVTDENPIDLNAFLGHFSSQEKTRLMFLDGITKALGGSNLRNCHLLASKEVVKFLTIWSTHTIVPTYYSMAVAQAAYEYGFRQACQPLLDPINASRKFLDEFLSEHNIEHIIGKGYYTFINLAPWLQLKGWNTTEEFGKFAAEEHGLAIVPGSYFSQFGKNWIRFSYALPLEKTQLAAQRLVEALNCLAH